VKRRRSNTLVALSSAAVMTIYAAGFMKTRAAADRLEHASRQRQPVIPAPAPAIARALEEPPADTAALRKPAAEAPKPVAVKPAAAIKAEAPKRPAEAVAPVATPPATPQAEVTAPVLAPAPPPVAAPAPTAAAPAPADSSPSAEVLLGGIALHNGTFLGWGTSRHGDIQASVTIYSGRITAVSIAQCRTRYSCDIIAHLPGKVLKDQTPEKINNVSGATQSVDAFYWAVIDAINKAK
jgi:uncharacterized protein with FMN-binding domain